MNLGPARLLSRHERDDHGALSRFNPAQPGARGHEGRRDRPAGGDGRACSSPRARSSRTIPWLGYVKAFAEAAMVGGLADWFAVTALFRHPLGLPIPHTAIIPRNKDRIGEALANFLKDNFLIPPVVARRMRNIDVAGAAGRFLQTPAGEGTRIRAGASRLIADMFESLDDERLGGIVKGAISARLRKTEVSPLLGHALASAINEDRHVPMLEAAIRWMARALDANEPLIRDMVHKRANWVLKLAGLDAKLADAIIDGLRKLTVEMPTDPAHPVRIKVEEALAQLANDLQTRPETRERVEAIKEQLLDNRSVGLWLDTLWQKGREAMIRAARNPDAVLAGKLGEVLKSMGATLESDRAHPSRDQPVRPPRRGRHGGELWRLDRQAGQRRPSAAGMRGPSPTGWRRRSAATCNISGSTARWSAGWSG